MTISRFLCRLGLPCLLLLLSLGCGRKDVDRHGQIKLRGDRVVTTEGKKPGVLLERGIASWYGKPYHGRKTANGEVYDMWAMTAAHKQLAFGTMVKVVDRQSDRSVLVRINDRGPFIRGRVIDLSRKAARELGIEDKGTTEVAIYLVRHGSSGPAASRPTVKPKPGDGFWTIQVGSFRELDRAKAMAREMQSYTKHVTRQERNGYHRVRAGKFPTKQEAVVLARKLADDGYDLWITFMETDR